MHIDRVRDAYAERVDECVDAFGSMDSVHCADRELVSVWSQGIDGPVVIHTPPAEVRTILAEFVRCIRPGGGLLLGFFEGAAVEPFAHLVVEAYRWHVEGLRLELLAAGFETIETHTRTGPGYRPHGAIVARRSAV
ncbi:hypothetical protein [Rhodococcus sp. ARC_M6]|uniref:hypothetical protein n=1 Tax=Rhodococcus sp. ARC_M6 TaxID=2928852 RepID=UPI001FB2EC3A|nr:hypothetical protein [Rhodococcus sp. ARC_M6]MCJ0906324.1 hypothetical protein [Rhodococcus sp. ARC_M6]